MRLDRRLRNLEASKNLEKDSGEKDGLHRLLALLDAIGERIDSKGVKSAAWYEKASPTEVAAVALKETETGQHNEPLSARLGILSHGESIPAKLFSAIRHREGRLRVPGDK